MNLAAQEAHVLESLVPKLEADGYAVYVHPSTRLLPPFMRSYVPDAIALGASKNLAIEIVFDRTPSTRLEKIRELFQDVQNWEFQVYYIRPAIDRDTVSAVPRTAIEASLRTIDKLTLDGQLQAALLVGWATLEALGRVLLAQKLTQPQGSMELVEVLGAEGLLTPSEADSLRRIAGERNRVAHGSLTADIDLADIGRLRSVVATLLELVPSSVN
jgi:uncharacterized protein YutE (UPF0331/DUF86 family)